MWGRLYLPMFLFRVGLLTLMYMDFLIVLAKPCPSLSTMLTLFMVVRWPMALQWPCIGNDTFKCYFPKCSSGFFNVFLIAINAMTSVRVYNTSFALYGVCPFVTTICS